jgi:hypothetical protein
MISNVFYPTKEQQEARFINDWTKIVDDLQSLRAALIYNIEEKDKIINRYVESSIKREGLIDKMAATIAHMEEQNGNLVLENERLMKELEFWKIDATLN